MCRTSRSCTCVRYADFTAWLQADADAACVGGLVRFCSCSLALTKGPGSPPHHTQSSTNTTTSSPHSTFHKPIKLERGVGEFWSRAELIVRYMAFSGGGRQQGDGPSDGDDGVPRSLIGGRPRPILEQIKLNATQMHNLRVRRHIYVCKFLFME